MAEALAIREALLHAAALGYSHICLRTDSQVLSRVINRRSSTIELFGILSDIDPLIFSPSSPFGFCNVVFVSPLANGPADHLAKAQLQSHLEGPDNLPFYKLNEFPVEQKKKKKSIIYMKTHTQAQNDPNIDLINFA